MFQPTAANPPAAASQDAGLSDAAARERLMLVTVGGHRIGIPIRVVREILTARPYTPLPGSAAHVAGLVNMRGRIVTVVDLGVRLGLAAATAHSDHSVVIVERAGTLFGFAVDGIVRILDTDGTALTDSGAALRALRLERAYVLGVGEVDDELFVAVDPEQILGALLA